MAESDGVRVHHEKKSDGVIVYHKKGRWAESSPLERVMECDFTRRKSDWVKVHHEKKRE